MKKSDIIKDLVLQERRDVETVLSKLCIELDNFIEILARDRYNLRDEFKRSNLAAIVFPNKPKSNVKICTWLLEKHGYKCCTKCKEVFTLEHFHKECGRRSGLANNCKSCSNNRTAVNTPKWANLSIIAKFYSDRPLGYHVDHIIPLNGVNVCGLHVEDNLCYLPEKINMAKNNKMPEDYFFSTRPSAPIKLTEISS